MRIVVTAVAFLIPVLFGQPAYADWQFTKWGMSPNQVVSSSNGAAHLVRADMNKPNFIGAEGNYRSGMYVFRASYEFNKGGLRAVSLSLREPSRCSALIADLTELYGSGGGGTVYGAYNWKVKKKNLDIVMFAGGNACPVIYYPFVTQNRSGL